jgi:hypothetical protein
MKKNKEKIKGVMSMINPLEDARDSMLTTFKLVVSALTLVSALAWNEAIKGIFDLLKENEIFKNTGFLAPFVYAVIVTLVTIIVINRLKKIEKKLDEKEAKKKKPGIINNRKI